MASAFKPLELAFRRSFLNALRLFGAMRTKPATKTKDFDLVTALGPSPSILLLRQDRLGDVLMSTFLMLALRERFPQSKIAILLGKNNAAAAPLLPIECETFVYRKNIPEDWKTMATIRSRKFDLAIDLTDNASVTSSILLTLAQARITLGVEKENSVVYDVTVPKFSREGVHITERVAELLRPLGFDPVTVDKHPKLKVNVQRIQGRVGLNVSSRTPERCAPPKASAEIANGVLQMGFKEVLVFSAPHDRERGTETVRFANNPSIYAAPDRTDFAGFAEQIASCEYLITADTSAIQIAAATGVPMVLLFRPMPGEHPWTPVGVPFEIHTQYPSLEALEPQPVLDLFKKLTDRQP